MLAAICLILKLLGTIIAIVGWVDVRRFLAAHSAIETRSDFEAFKSLARRNMYMTLALLVFLLPAFFMGLYLVAVNSRVGLALILTLDVPMLLISKVIKPLEAKARNLPCTPKFSKKYAQICEVWINKPFPNF
ncbi:MULTISPECIES: hypothetical protein [unclassified Microcoleus]|uniref:hypothetical protein n=2 Tax=Microcoleaceae TaxID=1892252 RepID=UPI002FD14DD2